MYTLVEGITHRPEGQCVCDFLDGQKSGDDDVHRDTADNRYSSPAPKRRFSDTGSLSSVHH